VLIVGLIFVAPQVENPLKEHIAAPRVGLQPLTLEDSFCRPYCSPTVKVR
jgi:hypothetical protein